jgi:hypothetical protein
MSKGAEDIRMLRLIRAFQKLTDRETRRNVVLSLKNSCRSSKLD